MPPLGVRIVDCRRDFVVAVKGAGIHSAPLRADDTSCALAVVAERFPEVLAVRGRKEVEGGLVHRIDFDTAGLLLLARSQDFYQHIISCQEAGLFRKGYTARCQNLPDCGEILGGFPPRPVALDSRHPFPAGFSVESGFRPYGPGRRQVRPVAEGSGRFSRRKAAGKNSPGCGPIEKGYATDFFVKQGGGETFLVEASIARGYRHQVRCHLAWCGLPILGDPLYNPDCGEGRPRQQMQFFATSLGFPSCDSSEILSFSISPDEI